MARWRARAPRVGGRRPGAPVASGRPVVRSWRPCKGTILGPVRSAPGSVLDLQRHAGNAAVADLLQRAPLGATDDPKGYTVAAGVQNVAASGMTRREVHGLKYGVTGGFQSKYTSKSWDKATETWKEKVRSSAEAKMTKESPDNMAVVVMPDTLDNDRPVQVVLHFHGWGFRGGTDPYAGYLVASGERGRRTRQRARHGARCRPGALGAADRRREHRAGGAEGPADRRHPGPGSRHVGLRQRPDVRLRPGRRVEGARAEGGHPVLDRPVGAQRRREHPGRQEGHCRRRADEGPLEAARAEARTGGSAADRPRRDVRRGGDRERGELGRRPGRRRRPGDPRRGGPAAAQAALAATPKFRGYFAAGGAYANRYTRRTTSC